MTDHREALARLIYEHEKVGRGCISCSERPGAESMNGHRYAEHVAELIAAEFLTVPRKDIQGYEYGFRLKESKVGERTYSTQRSRQDAIEFAGDLRDEQSRKGQDVNATAVQRTILPWTPIPEGGER